MAVGDPALLPASMIYGVRQAQKALALKPVHHGSEGQDTGGSPGHAALLQASHGTLLAPRVLSLSVGAHAAWVASGTYLTPSHRGYLGGLNKPTPES